ASGEAAGGSESSSSIGALGAGGAPADAALVGLAGGELRSAAASVSPAEDSISERYGSRSGLSEANGSFSSAWSTGLAGACGLGSESAACTVFLAASSLSADCASIICGPTATSCSAACELLTIGERSIVTAGGGSLGSTTSADRQL